MKPIAIDQADGFDYEIRAAALRLLLTKLTGPKHWAAFEIGDLLESPRGREVVDCLAAMALSGFLEYYGGHEESAEMTITREIGVAEDLKDAEAR
ncbi:hypothetical protein BTO20_14845 [Mycobacterium dioxanotrophicus]|uniref:Uncharacterized protein n=1 Tax=Mycobacterium dioxanotrophicus TaxID=482462 RepID=A0A1Y0C3M2_9MYCO|nr:hypothetical protein [Mycobacterium dioxanotrophicus]ART69697.1 hypothetical protein BTO20_14845 [Mycobacterium dioxanotrophicus]